MKCSLAEDINNCPFCDKRTVSCNNEKHCTYQYEEHKEKNPYVRKERWYEKYYKK